MPGDEALNLTPEQTAAIAVCSDNYFAAVAKSDDVARDLAHAAADAIRDQARKSQATNTAHPTTTGFTVGEKNIYPPSTFMIVADAIAVKQPTLTIEQVFKTAAQWLQNSGELAHTDENWLQSDAGLSVEARVYMNYYTQQKDVNRYMENGITTALRLAYDIEEKGRTGYIRGYYYDVQLFDQDKSSLCWAYSQVMVEAHHNGETITQAEANTRAETLAKKYHGTAKRDDTVDVYGPYVQVNKGWNNGGWPPNAAVLDAESISAKILQIWLERAVLST
jgi:hypothetical protein